jgi:hypothetical protein
MKFYPRAGKRGAGLCVILNMHSLRSINPSHRRPRAVKESAQTMRCAVCSGVRTVGLPASESECYCQAQNSQEVIDSPLDQTWADFCGGLQSAAFLLPITGFGDLEQS